MRTGLGTRIIFILFGAIGASSLALGLFALGAMAYNASPGRNEPNTSIAAPGTGELFSSASFFDAAFAVGLVLAGSMIFIGCFCSYFVIAELQGQSALVAGAGGGIRNSARREPQFPQIADVVPPKPSGHDLRVGRGDSWS